jgi:RND family efflux transporter MFP subunit
MTRSPILPLAVLLTLAGCAPEPEIREVIRPVEVFTTGEPLEHLERSFSGTALSAVNANLSFRVAGELIAYPVHRGQKMQAGELIGQIDPTDYELQVAQAQAAKAQAAAQALNAGNEFNRVRQLWENGSVSESEFERVKASDDSAEAQLEAAEKQLELAEKRLSYCTLVAPRAGVVADTLVEQNQVLAAGQVVVSFLSEDSIQVEIGIPEKLINEIHEGMTARVTFEAVPGESFTGVVVERGVVVGASSTYPVRITLEGPTSAISPGMIAEVFLIFPIPNDMKAIPIPSEAMVGRLEERFVWIFDETTSTVKRQDVVPSRLDGHQVFIRSGLQAGQIIIKRGVHRLEEGTKVRLPIAAQ